jgi:prophage tail gpP-like protein
MIQQICAPFGIKVTADVPQAQTVVYNFAVQLAETAFEAISRIAEQSGLLVVSDGRGGILLTNAGSAGKAASVILGKNILRARGHRSMKQRFSQYIVAAQTLAPDTMDPTSATIAQGKATDPNVTRYRPLIIMGDLGFNGLNYLQQRAQWEAAVRLGRGFRPTITVRGWRDDAGVLWKPNTTVLVQDEWLAVDRELLISGVRYLLDDEEGTRTELTLTLPEAFLPAPIPLVPTVQNMGGAP